MTFGIVSVVISRECLVDLKAQVTWSHCAVEADIKALAPFNLASRLIVGERCGNAD